MEVSIHGGIHSCKKTPAVKCKISPWRSSDKGTSLGIPVPGYGYWVLPSLVICQFSGSLCSRLPVSFKFPLRSPTTLPTMLTK